MIETIELINKKVLSPRLFFIGSQSISTIKVEVFLHEETMRRHRSPVKSVAVRYMLPVMGPVDGIDLNDVFLNNLQRTWCLCVETKISGNLARLVMGQLVGAPPPLWWGDLRTRLTRLQSCGICVHQVN